MRYTGLMLTDDQKHRIIQYVQNKPIELVYLFGSQATGRAGPLSDYDFAVLFNDELNASQRFDAKLDLISELLGIVKTDHVDVVDLNVAPNGFCYSAIFPKEELFVRSKEIMSEFEFQTLSETFDREYYVKRHTKESLKIIALEGLGN